MTVNNLKCILTGFTAIFLLLLGVGSANAQSSTKCASSEFASGTVYICFYNSQVVNANPKILAGTKVVFRNESSKPMLIRMGRGGMRRPASGRVEYSVTYPNPTTSSYTNTMTGQQGKILVYDKKTFDGLVAKASTPTTQVSDSKKSTELKQTKYSILSYTPSKALSDAFIAKLLESTKADDFKTFKAAKEADKNTHLKIASPVSGDGYNIKVAPYQPITIEWSAGPNYSDCYSYATDKRDDIYTPYYVAGHQAPQYAYNSKKTPNINLPGWSRVQSRPSQYKQSKNGRATFLPERDMYLVLDCKYINNRVPMVVGVQVDKKLPLVDMMFVDSAGGRALLWSIDSLDQSTKCSITGGPNKDLNIPRSSFTKLMTGTIRDDAYLLKCSNGAGIVTARADVKAATPFILMDAEGNEALSVRSARSKGGILKVLMNTNLQTCDGFDGGSTPVDNPYIDSSSYSASKSNIVVAVRCYLDSKKTHAFIESFSVR